MHTTSYTLSSSDLSGAAAYSATSSSSPATSHQHQPMLSVPVASREGDSEDSCINFSSPQCCHCGWRGTHSPSCPFRRH
ncbi:hypothetical protein BC834DRAFT_859611 [Gloeopeniophorella convolvens]|nr:hypothetical protein BC834DRAFT_859611 [Gloeopeniophorella convolvens]